MLPLVARNPAIDRAVSEYVLAQAEYYESLRQTPIRYGEDYAIERFADLVLYEELRWSHPDKMSIVDYPIMTGWQEELRNEKHIRTEEITFKDRHHNGRRKSYYFGKNGEVGVANHKMPDRYDSDMVRVENAVTVQHLLDHAGLTDKQRQAIELVYFDGLTQEQAGVEMGIRKHTVNKHISKGLRKLYEYITKEGELLRN